MSRQQPGIGVERQQPGTAVGRQYQRVACTRYALVERISLHVPTRQSFPTWKKVIGVNSGELFDVEYIAQGAEKVKQLAVEVRIPPVVTKKIPPGATQKK